MHLDPGETTNDEARTFYLDDELMEIVNQQWQSRTQGGKLLPYVFPNEEGTGKIKSFIRSWKTACKDAGIGKRLFHDLRRTAVRNMVRAGIPERVAMMVSGHKTRSVFERYNIVSDSDLREASKKQEKYLRKQNRYKTATIFKIRQEDKKRGISS